VGDAIAAAAAADPRIVATDAYASDADLAEEIHDSELVVLPFRQITNSGSVLLALSLDRPVLVPHRPLTEALAQEVGTGWVHLYDGELCAEEIEGALATVRGRTTTSRPDLSRRDWSPIGSAHAVAYRQAVGIAAGGDRRGRPDTRDRTHAKGT
jgi:beta-1,4-mannosyltransferase